MVRRPFIDCLPHLDCRDRKYLFFRTVPVWFGCSNVSSGREPLNPYEGSFWSRELIGLHDGRRENPCSRSGWVVLRMRHYFVLASLNDINVFHIRP